MCPNRNWDVFSQMCVTNLQFNYGTIINKAMEISDFLDTKKSRYLQYRDFFENKFMKLSFSLYSRI